MLRGGGTCDWPGEGGRRGRGGIAQAAGGEEAADRIDGRRRVQVRQEGCHRFHRGSEPHVLIPVVLLVLQVLLPLEDGALEHTLTERRDPDAAVGLGDLPHLGRGTHLLLDRGA